MAISNAKKRRIGRELVDWIYLGVRTGARRSTANYRALISTNPTQAKNELTRAINMPRRARARINKWIEDYDAINGAGAASVFMSECLALADSVTLGDINTELTAIEAQAQSIIDSNIGGWTLDQVATAIEGALEWEAKDWAFPLPESYTDIPLLDN